MEDTKWKWEWSGYIEGQDSKKNSRAQNESESESEFPWVTGAKENSKHELSTTTPDLVVEVYWVYRAIIYNI